jgi:hypothetical protein
MCTQKTIEKLDSGKALVVDKKHIAWGALFTAITFGQNLWYVNNTASGSNNGTSWTNAWKSFSNINWSSIQPGEW